MDKSQLQLAGLSVAILAVNGFEQAEMTDPRKALDEAGAKTTLISMNHGQVQGFHHDQPADKFDVQMTLEEAEPKDFDAVLLPGGVMNADQIRMSSHAQKFVQAMDREGKPVAVICHGSWLLVSAGLAQGRKLTSWPSLQDDLRNAGAQWVDDQVVVDRNWVSSRKPADIPAFNRELLKLIASRAQAHA
jgi:protease I